VRTVLALLAAAAGAGFQTGNYASSPVAPRGGPAANIHFTAGKHRVTHFGILVIRTPCHGPIARTHKSGTLAGGGFFSGSIDNHGRFKIRIYKSHGGETGTIKGHLRGTTATGTVTLQAHFFLASVPNPHGPSHCGVRNLAWTASTQFG
jgi:hypothetical protein